MIAGVVAVLGEAAECIGHFLYTMQCVIGGECGVAQGVGDGNDIAIRIVAGSGDLRLVGLSVLSGEELNGLGASAACWCRAGCPYASRRLLVSARAQCCQ